MKKKDIIRLLKAKSTIEENEARYPYKCNEINKYTYVSMMADGSCIPKVKEVKTELEVLKKEMVAVMKQTKEAQKELQVCGCKHEVRLVHDGFFGSDNYECVFCNQFISSNNNITWGYSKYRNAHCVNLRAKYQEDDDGRYVIKDGYTLTDVYNLVSEMIKDKDNEDEIDLVEEFSKLSIPQCTITNKKVYPEYYVLIVGGTNKYKVCDDSFIWAKKLNLTKEIVDYFTGIIDTSVLLIDNPDVSDQIKETRPLKVVSYNSIENLESYLKDYKHIDFNLVIDLSNLYEYSINGDTITRQSFNIDFMKYFPNCTVVKIADFNFMKEEDRQKLFASYADGCVFGHSCNHYWDASNQQLDEKQAFSRIRKFIKK